MSLPGLVKASSHGARIELQGLQDARRVQLRKEHTASQSGPGQRSPNVAARRLESSSAERH